MAQSRFWCFTLNNYTQDELGNLDAWCADEDVEYAVLGREIGDSGTPHIQGYIQFVSRKRIGSLRGRFARAHFEIARCPAKAAAYCKKDGEYSEFGEAGRVPTRAERGVRTLAASRREELADTYRMGGPSAAEAADPALWAYNGHTLIRNVHRAPLPRPDISGVWYFGPPGTGKSKLAWERYPCAYPKPSTTKWWNGYRGESVAIIDDLSPATISYQHLLVWVDRYPCLVETKGGMMPLEVSTIVVTSNYRPEEVWPDANSVSIAAVRRRFTFTEFSTHQFN
jgi:hypothetical protein